MGMGLCPTRASRAREPRYYDTLFFYDTDLGQNAVFHNFARQIALIQYSGRSKHACAFSETVKKISKISYKASRFSLLTSAKVDCLN